MHRSRRSVVIAATAVAGVLAMAGVAAAHGRPPAARSADDTTTTATGGSGGSGLLAGSGLAGGSGAFGGSGGSGGAGVAAGSGAVGGSGEVGDHHGDDAAGHDANDDRGNDAAGHDANDDHGRDDRGADETSTSIAHPSTTLASVSDGPHTFHVTGGTVIVGVQGGVLSLVSATPNAGFEIDKSESRADRIEVEFRSADTESRVRVRIDGGRLRIETGDH